MSEEIYTCPQCHQPGTPSQVYDDCCTACEAKRMAAIDAPPTLGISVSDEVAAADDQVGQ